MTKIPRIVTIFGLLVLFGVLSVRNAHAIFNPLIPQNNKYGIHLNDENDLEDAARLVNSSDGDWGYVTFVIREDEMNVARWQRAFDKMYELHLIPLVRIATKQADNGWAQAEVANIEKWAEFLDSLSWVIKNRYIIVGNEPNHATEWNGEIGPEEYSDYLVEFSRALKLRSSSFYVLPAGFDASAPSDARHMDEEKYIRRMVKHQPLLFNYIDGWTSHSYPNPGFVGLVRDKGRGSIRTFEWELELLESLGLEKELPVFITETGWAHETDDTNGLSTQKVSENFKFAFSEVWSDNRVVAITPFILNYPGEPFGRFSWKNKNGVFYDFYENMRGFEKIQGKPPLESNDETSASLHSRFSEKGNEVVKTKDNTIQVLIKSVYNFFHNFWAA